MISVLLFFFISSEGKKRKKQKDDFGKEGFTEHDFGDDDAHRTPLCLTTRDLMSIRGRKCRRKKKEGTEKDARRCLKLSVSFVFL